VKAKRDLIRIVISVPPNAEGSDLGSAPAYAGGARKSGLAEPKPRGEVFTIDLHGKKKGRGAYVCPNIDCIKKAMHPERLNRAFRISDRGVRGDKVTHDIGPPSARMSGSEKARSADHISLENISRLKQDLLELIET
jgi:predicted RNA-binding protein YlxR (DUF448 family)